MIIVEEARANEPAAAPEDKTGETTSEPSKEDDAWERL